MYSKLGFQCPGCQSYKYTSLPFANIFTEAGSVETYRCLRCSLFFVRPVQEVPHYSRKWVPSRYLSLGYNVETDTWDLIDETTDRVIKQFLTKEAATKPGVLENLVGPSGGSVVIRKKSGVYEELRNYGL